jgi:hypothetical protein
MAHRHSLIVRTHIRVNRGHRVEVRFHLMWGRVLWYEFYPSHLNLIDVLSWLSINVSQEAQQLSVRVAGYPTVSAFDYGAAVLSAILRKLQRGKQKHTWIHIKMYIATTWIIIIILLCCAGFIISTCTLINTHWIELNHYIYNNTDMWIRDSVIGIMTALRVRQVSS